MSIIEAVVDTLGTIVLVAVVVVLFGPYLLLDRFVFKNDRYIQ